MLCVHVITGLNQGGAEATLRKLVAGDNSGTSHVVVSLMDDGELGSLIRAAGIEVLCLGMKRGRFSLIALAKLVKIIKKYDPDVVQTWMYHADVFGGVAARIAGVKKVFWGVRHTELSMKNNSWSTILMARVAAAISGFIPYCAISCAQQSSISHAEYGYKVKFKVIPNGYDIETYRPNDVLRDSLRSDLKIGPLEVIYGCVARWHPQKDHVTLFKALKSLKEQGFIFRFMLVGEGCTSDNATLQTLLRKYQLAERAILLGRRSDIPAVMNSLDIHVLTSVGEGFPNCVAEAMLCGTPCVSTDAGDARVIIGGHGIVVDVKDSAAIADGIVKLTDWRASAEWPERERSMVEDMSAQYSLESMIKGFIKIWGADAK